MSSSKGKGTAAESAVVEYLRARGWPNAERRAQGGAKDRGDVAGVPGAVIEVKNEKRITLAAYVDEALCEQANDGARYGVAWVKRPRKGKPADWYVVMDGETFTRLLADALGVETPRSTQVSGDGPAGSTATTARVNGTGLATPPGPDPVEEV